LPSSLEDTLINVLVTGFEPFGGESINPSWEIARALPDHPLPGVRWRVERLPCVFSQAGLVLNEALNKHRPHLVLSLGQAGGRSELSLERVAINLIDARIPDNAGQQPLDQPIQTHGPAAYFSTWPIKYLQHGLRAEGFPASVSHTAGTFVCNQVFYELQRALEGQKTSSGFLHVPWLPEQAARQPGPTPPSLPLSVMVEGVVCLVRLWAAHQRSGESDLRVSTGSLH
jgi:pyroglutamyl-peptidase